MGRMSENRDTLFRQWTMLRRIPRYPQTVSTRQMAEYLADEDFQVAGRTVERDLDKLSIAFGYASEEHGRSNHWFWPSDFGGIDIPGLEPNTALAFNLAELHLKDLLPPSTLDLLAPYFDRARAVLDNAPGQSLVHWRDKIRVIGTGPQLAPAKIDDAIQRQIYDALLHETRVNIVYEPRSGDAPRNYEFSPLGLVSRHGVLYLVGPLWEYDNVVQLALHRIHAVENAEAPVHRPADFKLSDYVETEQGFSYPTGGGEIALVVHMDKAAAQHLIERPLSEDQQIEPLDNTAVRLSATVLDTDELTWWLLGFGSSVEVKEPHDVRERLRSVLETALGNYALERSNRLSV